MSKFNNSSYFPLQMLCRSAPKDVLFGPSTFKNERDCIYPKKKIPMNGVVIWLPKMHKTISLDSYFEAQEKNDTEAIAKIEALGIPMGIDFKIHKTA